ncbi:hypothetical protein KP509_26G066200 [Ceratopteris richardii]|uniref:NIF system FeS cluster assembly NifU N-terminal domain-containing protein n=1 Tax=Ceratopteris richardii TaxID=49495 RepID=A0A8T2RNT5_CERRI|nr:hypothetical protein KP509_26G066200 [Ceratopteris richardii]
MGDSCFKTFECGFAIASPSVAAERIKGKSMEEVLMIKNSDTAKHLSLPPVKLHCSMLVEDAIKAALKDFKSKNSSQGSCKSGVTNTHDGISDTKFQRPISGQEFDGKYKFYVLRGCGH